MRCPLSVFMFFNNGCEALAADLNMRGERVRHRDFLDGLQIIAAIRHHQQLPRAIGPHNLDRR